MICNIVANLIFCLALFLCKKNEIEAGSHIVVSSDEQSNNCSMHS